MYERNFKGLSPPATPFGKRRFIRIVESTIPKATVLSIAKIGCENYLFDGFNINKMMSKHVIINPLFQKATWIYNLILPIST